VVVVLSAMVSTSNSTIVAQANRYSALPNAEGGWAKVVLAKEWSRVIPLATEHWNIQSLLDVLLSRNVIMGTCFEKKNKHPLPNNGYQQDDQPPLYFSNADLLWAAGYHLPRLGQGGFREAFEGVWAAVTSGP
jgi:hypothetical protein